MKYIKLTQGKRAMVDDEDFEFLIQWKWGINSCGYAVRHQHISGSGKNRKRIIFLMHRVLNNTPDKYHTDHMNGNKLDNRKKNLRTLTVSENIFYSKHRKNNTSGHKGVYWDRTRKLWHAQICRNRKVYFIGRFEKIADAIKHYKIKKQLLWN
jgi:hypothetical protein